MSYSTATEHSVYTPLNDWHLLAAFDKRDDEINVTPWSQKLGCNNFIQKHEKQDERNKKKIISIFWKIVNLWGVVCKNIYFDI